MTGINDSTAINELLAHLRREVRKSRQLAEGLTGNVQVGGGARVLLARLLDIAAELETMKAMEISLRQVANDPVWPKPHWNDGPLDHARVE